MGSAAAGLVIDASEIQQTDKFIEMKDQPVVGEILEAAIPRVSAGSLLH